MLTLERLKELLSYDPLSGEFRWLETRGRRWSGKIAGALNEGYVQIKIDGRLYQAHRLAFLFMTGEFPNLSVDHVDCSPSNNRWDNLREANKSSNGANRGAQINNNSGLKGVHWHKQTRKWRAKIMINRRTIHLGLFDTAEEAHASYMAGAVKHFGEFARAA